MKKNYFTKRLMEPRMTIYALLLCLFCSVSSASAQKPVQLNATNQSMATVMADIEKQTRYNFFYNNNQINTARQISISSDGKDLKQVLDMLFAGTDITYSILDKSIVLSLKAVDTQTKHRISGTVNDAAGKGILGANVLVKGNNLVGTTTDPNGKFSLEVTGSPTLVVSFLGFESVEVPVGSKQVIDVVLKEDAAILDEVVVTALGLKREEKALGYSVQRVSGDDIAVTKGLDVASGLNGKIAGVSIANSTEFGERPEVTMRGEAPLIVVDGVAYGNVSLNDLSADDIADMSFLKGATASALYGSRGRGGAIMITTKKAEGTGEFTVSLSNNTMFSVGYLRVPGKQDRYSTGSYGNYELWNGYVWGDIMDGHLENQWDPIEKTWKEMPLLSRGSNNVDNFFENSLVTNSNISVSQSGKLGGFRVSGTQVHTKGQFPGTKMDKYILNGGGNINYKNFKLDANFSYKRETAPNIPMANYGGGNVFYNMLVWTGTEYDVTQYKDYWLEKDKLQNWQHCLGWYNNPYFIANEMVDSRKSDVFNANLTMSYELMKGLSLMFRSGYDNFNSSSEYKEAIGAYDSGKGAYNFGNKFGSSFSNDLLLTADFTYKDFGFNGLAGISSYYNTFTDFTAKTQGGLSIPAFYSLQASIDKPLIEKEMKSKAVYSAYAKIGVSWKSGIYVDVTGRNDWSSTLPEDSRSYFYPSVSGSVIPTQFYNPIPKVLDMWKLRASWTIAKKDLDIYDLNQMYDITNDLWGGNTGATFPNSLRNPKVRPETERSFEVGTDLRFFGNRLGLDFTYFNRLRTNRLAEGTVSSGSGYEKTLTNTKEDLEQRGFEITLHGKPVVTKNFTWDISLNGGAWHWYYKQLDPTFSSQDPRNKVGERYDKYYATQWERDASGNIVHVAGLPKANDYQSVYGYKDPDFVAGMTNRFVYKNFELSFTIDGRFGGRMFSWTDNAMWHSGSHPDSDNKFRYDEVVNGLGYVGQGVKIVSGTLETDPYGKVISDTRVFAPNDVETTYSDYIMNLHPTWSDVGEDIKDATFIKLREVALNYNLPGKWAQAIGMKNVRVGVIGNNLLMWTKDFRFSDPDRGYENLNSPSLRYLGFNVNLTF